MPKKILVVDDDLMILNLFKQYFKKEGCSIIITNDPLEVWHMFQEGLDVDIVFTDYEMPKINGVELATKIKKITKAPIVLMSGNMDKAKKEKKFSFDLFAHFLDKPFTTTTLESVLIKIIV